MIETSHLSFLHCFDEYQLKYNTQRVLLAVYVYRKNPQRRLLSNYQFLMKRTQHYKIQFHRKNDIIANRTETVGSERSLKLRNDS